MQAALFNIPILLNYAIVENAVVGFFFNVNSTFVSL